VPNDCARVVNAAELAGRVALCDRGVVPLVSKVLRAQSAGAAAVVIVDDGGCTEDLDDCGRAGGVRAGGFAPKDDVAKWRDVTVPAILVSRDTGARLRRVMHPGLVRRDIPTLGAQYLNDDDAARGSSSSSSSSPSRQQHNGSTRRRRAALAFPPEYRPPPSMRRSPSSSSPAHAEL